MNETLPLKSVIVMRYLYPRELRHTYAASLELAEATGSTVLVVASGISIESFDENEMRMHGWVRA